MADMEENAWAMVQRQGKQFVVNNQPLYVNGFNTYWLMVFAVDQSTRAKVSEVFQQASSVGLTVCRTWAFNDGQWRALQKTPSVYDEDVFKVNFQLIHKGSSLQYCYNYDSRTRYYNSCNVPRLTTIALLLA